MNSINLTGRLTADVELKQTPSGVPVCTFNLAVDRPKVKDTTDFIRIVAWKSTAEFITRYFRKGNKIEITGVLTTRKWQDNSGNNRVTYEVVAENVGFGESKGESKPEMDTQPNLDQINVEDADLPF